jgi:hypothetical protein
VTTKAVPSFTAAQPVRSLSISLYASPLC